jgi:hypothetical protein
MVEFKNSNTSRQELTDNTTPLKETNIRSAGVARVDEIQETIVDTSMQGEMWRRIEVSTKNGGSDLDRATIAAEHGNKPVQAAFMEDHQKTMSAAWKAIDQARELGASDAALARIAKTMGAPGIAEVLLEKNNADVIEAALSSQRSESLVSRGYFGATSKEIKENIDRMIEKAVNLPELQSDISEALRFIDKIHLRNLGEAQKLTGAEKEVAKEDARKSYTSGLTELAKELEEQLRKQPNTGVAAVSDTLSGHGAKARQQIDSLVPGTMNQLGILRNSLKL